MVPEGRRAQLRLVKRIHMPLCYWLLARLLVTGYVGGYPLLVPTEGISFESPAMVTLHGVGTFR